MIAYASRTGTRRNLAALREYGWRLLISATGCHRNEGFRYAIDNGAWTAFQKHQPFDEPKFLKLVEKYGVEADWTVIPDVVGDREGTLKAFEVWYPRLSGLTLLFAVQDGMTVEDLPDIGPTLGIFVGGTTDWKERSIRLWAAEARQKNAVCHVGRVNSVRRIRLCIDGGATSFDGTKPSRRALAVPQLSVALKQPHFGFHNV